LCGRGALKSPSREKATSPTPLFLEQRARHCAFLTSDGHDTHVHISCFHNQHGIALLAVISRGDNTNEAPDGRLSARPIRNLVSIKLN
jgi:hypothetical protein